MLQKIAVVLLLVLLITGCASQTVFLSEPPGAEVFVNGTRVGTTPLKYDYNLNAGGDYLVSLKKPGYETVKYTMACEEVDKEKRNFLLTAGALIPGGSVLWLGAFFTKGLKDTYEFTLREEESRYTALAEKQERPF